MSMLGEVLDRLTDRSEVFALLTEAEELGVIARLNEAAENSAQDPCNIALDAVRAFAGRANDEAWVKLMGRIQGAQSPAGACLAEMISWSLAQ